MKTLKDTIWECIEAYSDIPDFIKKQLFALIPHSEDEFVRECLVVEPNGMIFSSTHALCPTCKKIEKLEKKAEIYNNGTCKKCGTTIYRHRFETVYCSGIIFSNDTRLFTPGFYKIKCEYHLISKKISVKVLVLNQKEGSFSDFLKESDEYYAVKLHNKGPSANVIIKDFLASYKHSGYDTYMGLDKYLNNPLYYCMLYIRYPQVELLVKTKYANIIRELIFNPSTLSENLFKRNFKRGKNLKEILVAPEWVYDPKLTLAEINDARITYTKYKPSKESFQSFLDLNLRKNEIKLFKQILAMKYHEKPLYTFDKLISYIGRCDIYQAIYPFECVVILRDYLNMCITMDVFPEVNSNSLKREHDIAARNYKLIVDKLVEDNFIKRANQLSKYEYENKNFKVIVPKTPQELINEGKNNRNCVGSYVKYFSEGHSKIFFIRNKKHIDTSYVTLEMRGSCITQAYLSANRTITDKSTLNFITEWQDYLKENKIISENNE